ncbi:SET domain-containing protein-lysine N-methyltransferase [Nostoc sp. FACHB-110]|uniref:SET domain-containing protein-lysine N-methyltransferase n=1 Tax=Nostoc sp. FACHB-110 TaxID=2692834 RepID=UPI001689C277|nr:SET domain-containing protein-lysine N-methyltransferase [Nostoc sp. FACHB-110]MBD2440162.1 SET domain-containing protein [Nostoc sp. FACHB-110]
MTQSQATEVLNTNSSLADSSITINKDNFFKIVGQRDRDRKSITTKEFKKGEVIAKIASYSLSKKPDFLTVQINHEEHILDLLLEAMNHSCSPTTFVDTQRMVVVAERDLSPGEELTFFYPSTEWEMDRPFQCHCQSPNCIGFVAGAKRLTIQQMVSFKLNDHIKNLTKQALHL